jgi:hypothetical protein
MRIPARNPDNALRVIDRVKATQALNEKPKTIYLSGRSNWSKVNAFRQDKYIRLPNSARQRSVAVSIL